MARTLEPSDLLLDSPWYISAKAVKDYLAITGRPDDDGGPEWERAEKELVSIARQLIADGKLGKPQRSGAVEYRGRKPMRLRIIVSFERRAEGDKPQMIAVRAAHQQALPQRKK